MRQSTRGEAGFQRYSKQTRRELFLQEMDRVVPWEALLARIEPVYYPKKRGAGRPAVGLERMLRIHFLQHWFNLSDLGVEEALWDSRAMRQFVGIDLGWEPAPDETTICKFRHLLEANGLGEAILQAVGEHLKSQGLRVSGGTIVDATSINALVNDNCVFAAGKFNCRRAGCLWHAVPGPRGSRKLLRSPGSSRAVRLAPHSLSSGSARARRHPHLTDLRLQPDLRTLCPVCNRRFGPYGNHHQHQRRPPEAAG